jgi:hypothetical protein
LKTIKKERENWERRIEIVLLEGKEENKWKAETIKVKIARS